MERLAEFIWNHSEKCADHGLFAGQPNAFKDEARSDARAMVRDLPELEEILAEIMVKGGRF